MGGHLPRPPVDHLRTHASTRRRVTDRCHALARVPPAGSGRDRSVAPSLAAFGTGHQHEGMTAGVTAVVVMVAGPGVAGG